MKRSKAIYFFTGFISFVLVLISELIYYNEAWIFDAGDYWNRGQMLVSGNFALESIDGFRGYFYPMWLAVVSFLGGGRIGWFIANAVIISVFITVIIPKLINAESVLTFNSAISLLAGLVILIVLFKGTIVYPLSDMAALILMSCSALAIKYALRNNKGVLNWAYLFLSGIFAYWAYNVRTIYMFSIFAVVFVYIFVCIHENSHCVDMMKSIFKLFISLCGAFCASIPQMIMNFKNLEIISPMVQTNGLMLQQVVWGLQYQRYDTYVGTNPVHPNAQIYFVDIAGQRILEQSGLVNLDGWGDFFHLFLEYPIDILSIYVRHLVNMLFPCWPEMYVKDLDSSKWFLGLIGISIIFFEVFAMFENCLKSRNSLLYFIPLIIPGILIIPGAVEYRFSLSFYVFAISQLVMNLDISMVKEVLIKRKWSLLVSYVTVLALCFAVWSSMLASESVTSLLF